MSAVVNFFKNLFTNVGKLIRQALQIAEGKGLVDGAVERALALVREAAERFITNVERREWVVAELVKAGMPESVARLAVELAVQLWKKEVAERQAQ